MILRYFCMTIFLLLPLCGKAQVLPVVDSVYYTGEDRAVFDRFIKEVESEKSLPTGELTVKAALFFLGVPYVAATLERVPEKLVVNFSGLDCMTLVENTVALVRTLQMPSVSFDNFCHVLSLFRYRDNMSENLSAGLDYTDRLHYTTDWIYENQKQGRIKDITKEIGGKPLAVNLSFMSTHPDSYVQLKDSPERVAQITAKEKEINTRSYFYLPKEDIGACARGIKDGDIICFVTNIKGLDISHVGIAYRVGDKLTFIHASSVAKKVIVNEESLEAYTKRIKSNAGIMVIRQLSPSLK